MTEIREVKTKKEQKEFLDFPIDLYRGNPNFVPPLYVDEKKIFKKDYVYYDKSEAVYFNAYRDGKIVGRISGILQKAYNEKHGEKRIRFTRFDSINDRDVAKALFDAVEQWGISKGMDTICGPLGFSDLEREGLLIDGFDQLATFEEQYNADYYQTLIENLGYIKEVDWTESKISLPDNCDFSLDKLSNTIMKKYNLHVGTARTTNEFLDKYKDGIFEVLDSSYEDIYGTVPFTEGMKKMLIDNFRLIIDRKFCAVILDENDKMVCFGLCFPSLAEAMQKSDGHLTPSALCRVLKAVKKPKVIDFALIGVDPKHLNHGVSVIIAAGLMHMLKDYNIEHCETNLNLEDNAAIHNLWKRFKEEKHKRRRSYIKSLIKTEQTDD